MTQLNSQGQFNRLSLQLWHIQQTMWAQRVIFLTNKSATVLNSHANCPCVFPEIDEMQNRWTLQKQKIVLGHKSFR